MKFDILDDGGYIKALLNRNKELDKLIREKAPLTDEDAFYLVDGVIDTLIEVGNGVTDEMLHAEADKLFALRDQYIELNIRKKKEKQKEGLGKSKDETERDEAAEAGG